MRARSVFVAVMSACLVGFVPASGCFGVDGDKVATTETYRASDGSYSLDYVTPPWRVDKDDDTVLRLLVDAKVFGFSIGDNLPPTHLFLASKVNLKDTLEELIDTEAVKNALKDQGIEINDLPDHLPDLPDLGINPGGDGTGEDDEIEDPIPEYLVGVDLAATRDVATAELNFLLENQDAELESGLQALTLPSGQETVVYEVVMAPGVFVRNFYLPTQHEALRLSFISIFDLENADIDKMVNSVVTDAPLSVGVAALGGAQ